MAIKAPVAVLLSIVSAGALAEPLFEGLEMEKAALEKYCRADVERLCPGVAPGGGRIKECLMQHKEEMSVGCARALEKLKKAM